MSEQPYSKSQTRRENIQAGLQQCGHPVECIASADEGTHYCLWCEEVAQQAAAIERLRDGLKTIRDTCDEPQGGKGIEVLHKLVGVVIPNLCDETLDDDEPMNERGPAAGYK